MWCFSYQELFLFAYHDLAHLRSFNYFPINLVPIIIETIVQLLPVTLFVFLTAKCVVTVLHAIINYSDSELLFTTG